MLRNALRTRLQLPKHRHYASNPHSSSPLSSKPPRKELYILRARTIINILIKHTPHLSLVLPFGPPSEVRSQEETQWAHITESPNLASALDHVNHTLSTEAAEGRNSSVLPTWVILSVLSKPPSTAYEAFAVTVLALHHPHTSHETFPLVHLLSVYWLAKFSLYAPLHSVLLRLIYAKHELQSLHIALMLRILAQAQPANELQTMMALLLDFAIRRHLDLGVRTYRFILENPGTTSSVGKKVEQHMESRGYSPNLAHSQAFVRIYGSGGRRMFAARFWRRIRHGDYYGPQADYVNDRKSQALFLEETLRASKRPKQLGLYIKYLLKIAARAESDPAARHNVLNPILPSATGIPKKVFMASLRVLANDVRTPSRNLLSVLRSGLHGIGGGTKRLWCYSVVIKGLLRRAEYDEAAELLSEIWDEREKFSAPETTVAVETLTMVGRPDAALRLLLSLLPKIHMETDATQQKQKGSTVFLPRIHAPAARTIDTHAVNSFMVSLLRIGRLDAVFFIWDTMPRLFHVEPDSISLAIVLKAARYARKNEGALQVAIADFGLGRVLPRKAQAADWTYLGKDDPEAALQALLVAPEKRANSAFWGRERAGVVALRIASEVLTSNWPELRGFTAPFQAVRRNAGEQATSPVVDLLHSLASHSGDSTRVEAHSAFPYDQGRRTYSKIVPEDDMFRAWFDLLAEEDGAAQIPLILTWMRYLKVRPSRDTLATALVHWGEVTFEGPWIQQLRGGESQYIKLLKWVTKWVGRINVPGRVGTQKALMRVKWFREMEPFRAKRVADIAKERFNS